MQEILRDVKNGKEQNWRKHKLNSLYLSESYKRLGFESKFLRIQCCGGLLEFKQYLDGTKELHSAYFCKVRLCPMCAWRRSRKIFGQVSKIMDYLTKNEDYRYIFLTLTVRNVHGEQLSNELDTLFKSFNLLTKRKEFKPLSNGWFRCLEVTHDMNKIISMEMYRDRRKYYDKLGLRPLDPNPNFDMYHPHFHMVIAVNKSYFKESGIYQSQKDWTELWKSCLGVSYDPIVDVRSVKALDDSNDYKKAVAEVAKYAVKASDMMMMPPEGFEDNEEIVSRCHELTDDSVAVFDGALHNRRLVAFGGKFKEVHKLLNLDDADDGNLIKTDIDDELRDDLSFVLVRFGWSIGSLNYVRV